MARLASLPANEGLEPQHPALQDLRLLRSQRTTVKHQLEFCCQFFASAFSVAHPADTLGEILEVESNPKSSNFTALKGDALSPSSAIVMPSSLKIEVVTEWRSSAVSSLANKQKSSKYALHSNFENGLPHRMHCRRNA